MLSTILGLGASFLKSKSSILIDVILGLIIVIIIGFGYNRYRSMKSTIALQKTQLTNEKNINTNNQNKIKSLQKLNRDNLKNIKKLNTRYKSNMGLLQQKYLKDAYRIKVVTKIKEHIKYIQPKDNGVTAPVLKNTLEQIRKIEASK